MEGFVALVGGVGLGLAMIAVIVASLVGHRTRSSMRRAAQPTRKA